jgi:radical SAM superfamily enzyme YgiQ (UPF0313 family)
MTWEQIAETQRLLADEQGTIQKDWGGKLPIALVFPNTYYVGMSSLAVQTLYRLWNAREDVVCERVFTDQLPPLSLESGVPLDYFPAVAFSIAYEMDYFNVAALLRAGGIPLRAADRDEIHPLLIAGGPAVSANPEPLAPLLDAFVIGEIEPIFDQLTNTLQMIPGDRDTALQTLATIPGLYVPNAVLPEGDFPGMPGRRRSAAQCLPISQRRTGTVLPNSPTITRQWLRNLDDSPIHSTILTPNTEFANMGLIEIARGCGRGCRFCLAGYAYRPPRQRSVESILAQARELLRHTDRLGLVSAAVSDHAEIDRLATELRNLGVQSRGHSFGMSVSSMRVDPVSEPLLRALAESGTRTLTIAPEAGSERLRKVINKTQTEDDVLQAVALAARYDFEQIKLYFMLGLPTEEQDDVQALVDLTLACSERFPRQVTVNITPFVPKAHTPFQRLAQTPAKVVKRRLTYVERDLWKRGVAVKSESPAWAEVQGMLARGDRRLAEALLAAERITPATWKEALSKAGLSAGELLGTRAPDEPLPWDFIESGMRAAHLEREKRRSEEARTSAPCPPEDCVACGVCGPDAHEVK